MEDHQTAARRDPLLTIIPMRHAPSPAARRAALVGALTLGVTLAACHSAGEPEWRREVGRVEPALSSSPALLPPMTVRAGVPFDVTVTTVGSSSCTRPDGVSVQVMGPVAELVPYDLELSAAAACTDDLRPFPRTVRVRFDVAGEAVVRLRARSLSADGPVTLEVPVRVAP